MAERIQRKRSRACEPCRRKKVKCTGERPVCAFCSRLGQTCEYKIPPSDIQQNDADALQRQGMGAIEAKLDKLLELSLPNISHLGRFALPTDTLALTGSSCNKQHQRAHQVNRQPSRSLILHDDYTRAYLKWGHNQPLYLFQQRDFLESFPGRDEELRLAAQVLGSRLLDSLSSDMKDEILEMTKTCRRLVLERVSVGRVKLSTLQTLCLLSQISFSDGNTMQAGLDLATAQYFADALPNGSYLGDSFECSLCMQSIVLLRNLQGSVTETFKAGLFNRSVKSDSWINSSFNWSTRFPLLKEPPRGSDPALDILPYVAQAAEVWQMARSFAAATVTSEAIPPWSPQSEYSAIMLRLLEVDSLFPLRYRFARSNFSSISLDKIQQHRDYWGAWFLVQFLHSAAAALANHPFLLSMRLKSYKRLMPQTFIHQSFDQIARHTGWIICFIDLLAQKDFHLFDPTIAHCVAIVATIHLQHSFVEDENLRGRAQRGYEKCMAFLKSMSKVSLLANNMAENLSNLQNSVVSVPRGIPPGQQHGPNETSLSTDAQLLWKILIYETSGRPYARLDNTLFEDQIVSESRRPAQDVTEFAMVGSAGISGHNTVPRGVSAYAPKDVDNFGGIQNSSSAFSVPAGEDLNSDYLYFTGALHDQSYNIDQLSDALQPEDFGKTFHEWFSLVDLS